MRPGWARVWVSLRREAPLSGCYLGCCVLAAARVLLRWSVCTRVALAEKAQAACRRRWPLARTWGLGGIAGLPVWIQAAALSGEILFPANLAFCTKSRNAAVSGGLSSSRSRQWRRLWVTLLLRAPQAQWSGSLRAHVALHSSRTRMSQRCWCAGASRIWRSQVPARGWAKLRYRSIRSWLGVFAQVAVRARPVRPSFGTEGMAPEVAASRAASARATARSLQPLTSSLISL